MISTLKNAWKIPDLKKKILFTILFVTIFRLGNFIPAPGVDRTALSALTERGGLFSFYDLVSGGAFSSFSIFAMGVIPYINASIIMQLLVVAVPYLEQLSKEGEDGRKKIQNYTRYGSIALGTIQAYGSWVLIHNTGALLDYSITNTIVIMITLVTASTFLIWLGDQITVYGVGNGISVLIFINIISRFPAEFTNIFRLLRAGALDIVTVALFTIASLGLLAAVIVMSLAERRISVQYAGKTVGAKTYRGQSSHIPISVTASAVIAIIFAMSVMQFPEIISQFFWPESAAARFIQTNRWSMFNRDTWLYAVVYAVLVIFFTWFYSQVTFKPDEMAENMHKSAGFIPGIRPGQPTAKYITKILGRVALIGGMFAAIIAIFPIIVAANTEMKNVAFGGTAMLIMVGVSLDTMRQIESQLVMRHYQGFLK
jgi:preprotein translocase subunit SecY